MAAEAPSVAAHPRAARAVARAKGWGGLAGFVLGGSLSLPTNTLAAAGLRALVAGLICYVAVWAGAVFLWRRLVMLEIKGRQQRLLAGADAGSPRRQPSAASKRPNARAS
jgi:predicted lipid-binding transport protein (Tim44 family)